MTKTLERPKPRVSEILSPAPAPRRTTSIRALIALLAVVMAASVVVGVVLSSESEAGTIEMSPGEIAAAARLTAVAESMAVSEGLSQGRLAEAARLGGIADVYSAAVVLNSAQLAEAARWEAMARVGRYLDSQDTYSDRIDGLAESYSSAADGGNLNPVQRAAADRWQGLADSFDD